MTEMRKYNTAGAVFMQLLKADGSGYADDGDWTPGAGDVKVALSTNGTTFASSANIATLPSYDATHLWWVFPLSAGELTSKITAIRIVDAALKDDGVLIETFGNASAMYPDDLSTASAATDGSDFDAIPWNAAWDTDVESAVWSAATRVLTGSQGIKKNTAKAAFPFRMTDSTTHEPAPGLTVTAERSLDGAAFAACANAVAEISAGFYKITLAAGDLNGDTVALKFTAAGADPLGIIIVTSP